VYWGLTALDVLLVIFVDDVSRCRHSIDIDLLLYFTFTLGELVFVVRLLRALADPGPGTSSNNFGDTTMASENFDEKLAAASSALNFFGSDGVGVESPRDALLSVDRERRMSTTMAARAMMENADAPTPARAIPVGSVVVSATAIVLC
jgi:hypothetical protein